MLLTEWRIDYLHASTFLTVRGIYYLHACMFQIVLGIDYLHVSVAGLIVRPKMDSCFEEGLNDVERGHMGVAN